MRRNGYARPPLVTTAADRWRSASAGPGSSCRSPRRASGSVPVEDLATIASQGHVDNHDRAVSGREPRSSNVGVWVTEPDVAGAEGQPAPKRSWTRGSTDRRDRARHGAAGRRSPGRRRPPHSCVELFTALHLAGRELLVPTTVVAEVGYLLAREAGVDVEAMFLGAIADGDFRAADFFPTTSGVRPTSSGSTGPPARYD